MSLMKGMLRWYRRATPQFIQSMIEFAITLFNILLNNATVGLIEGRYHVVLVSTVMMLSMCLLVTYPCLVCTRAVTRKVNELHKAEEELFKSEGGDGAAAGHRLGGDDDDDDVDAAGRAAVSATFASRGRSLGDDNAAQAYLSGASPFPAVGAAASAGAGTSTGTSTSFQGGAGRVGGGANAADSDQIRTARLSAFAQVRTQKSALLEVE